MSTPSLLPEGTKYMLSKCRFYTGYYMCVYVCAREGEGRGERE